MSETPKMIQCVTRDGESYDFPGPPNFGDGLTHCACMRFSVGHGTWQVTFRKFEDSERFGEVSAKKNCITE